MADNPAFHIITKYSVLKLGVVALFVLLLLAIAAIPVL